MRNKIALLFLSQLLPQKKKRWSNLFEEYPDKVGDPHVCLSWKKWALAYKGCG